MTGEHGRAAALWPLLAALLAALTLVAAAASAALAQQTEARTDDVEIFADEGIEWQRERRVYVARGNALIRRNDGQVSADTISAYYRGDDDDNEVWKVEAIGNVVFVSEDNRAYGDSAVYDDDNEVMVMRGENLRIESEDYTLTARDTIEYWDARRMVVARGDAVITHEDQTFSAGIIVGYLKPEDDDDGGDGSRDGAGETATAELNRAASAAASDTGAASEAATESEAAATEDEDEDDSGIERVEAFDNVVISSEDGTVRADKAVFVVGDETATLFGNVEIVRNENTLRGSSAEINLDTGVARLLSGSTGRVRGVIKPKDDEDGDN